MRTSGPSGAGPSSGLVRVRAECRDGKAERIFVQNLPSFAQKLSVPLEVEGLGTLTVDTAYGGDSFVIVDAADHFRPRLAIELDGKSHQKAEQQYRDSVKDVIFRSGGLTLLRLPSRRYSVAELRNELRRAGLKSGN